jgi:hypothetical protein
LNTRAAQKHWPHEALVLLANEPRVYRGSIAQVFRQLRPNVEVMTAEPEELEDRVLRLAPRWSSSARTRASCASACPFGSSSTPATGRSRRSASAGSALLSSRYSSPVCSRWLTVRSV